MDFLAEAYMLVLLIVTCSLKDSSAQVKFSFNKNDCYDEKENLILRAQYTGGGVVESVNWYFYRNSQSTGTNTIEVTSCQVFGDEAPDLPNDRLSYDCDIPSDTYTATLSSVTSSDQNTVWGVSFSITGQSPMSNVKKTLTICGGFPIWAIVLIVILLLGVAGVIIAVVCCYHHKRLCFK